MKPFYLTEVACNFKTRFPSFTELQQLYAKAEYSETLGVCRSWITEGIPHAFSETPLLFEKIREHLANSIGIHPRDITLVGSARTGYSLNPHKIGNQFSTNSDLDFAVVSHDYFSKCEKQFLEFKNDFAAKRVTPNNPNQADLWPEIIDDIEHQRTDRKFIDICKIPTKPGYKTAQDAVNACWQIAEKLKVTRCGFSVKKCSIRVYRDNQSLIQQASKNLQSLFKPKSQ